MKTITAIFLLLSFQAVAQRETGSIKNEKDKSPIAYANIGVIGKGVGTVSDTDGSYTLNLDPKFNSDSIKFSCIGFEPYTIVISEYKHMGDKSIYLKEKPAVANSITAIPEDYSLQSFGQIGHSGFIEINGGITGSEAGVILHFTKPVILKTIRLNIDTCSLDTVFMRINVYRVAGEKQFENVLSNPIYARVAKKDFTAGNNMVIDLSNEYIQLKGDHLFTIEQIRPFSNGVLKFTGTKHGKTYGRRSSQAKWRLEPVSLSLQVDAWVAK